MISPPRSPSRLAFATLGLFAGVVATAAASASPALARPPVATRAAKGPYVTSVSDTAATIRFELDEAAVAVVEVVAEGRAGSDAGATGATGASGAAHAAAAAKARFESTEASAMHVVHAAGLVPGTRYAYAIRSGAGAAPLASGHFVTAPPPDSSEPQTFVVYGDDRTDDDAHAAVVRAIAAVAADFLVNTGDMVADGGSATNWTTFFDIERDLLRERPLFAAIGNHELYDDAAGANFSRYFGFPDASGAMRPYGSLRYGAIRLFFLNGMDDWSGGPERDWLDHELASADNEAGVTWRFAIIHQGPWSSGPHGPNPRLAEAHIPELLAAHKIDLVFAGHDHLYERGDGGLLKYVISGGGGAPVYRDLHATTTARKVEPSRHFLQITTHRDSLQMLATRVDGSALDRCGFVKGGPWDCDAPPAPAGAAAPALAAAAPGGPGGDAGGADRAGGAVAPAPRSSACSCDTPGRGPGGEASACACASLVVLAGVIRARRTCADSRGGSRRGQRG